MIIKNFFRIEGRIGRLNFLLTIFGGSILMAIAKMAIGGVFLFLLWILFSWILVCVGVRRVHDLDKSGGYAWLLLIPFAPIYVACLKGTVGENQYGADPLGGISDKKSFEKVIDVDIKTKPNNTDNTDGIKIIGIIFVVFAVILVSSIFLTGTSEPVPATYYPDLPSNANISTDDSLIPTNQLISNPEYLSSPSDFLVDRENSVSVELPPRKPGQPVWLVGGEQVVWVEQIISENKVLASYVAEVGGRKILKFYHLYIDGLSNYDSSFVRSTYSEATAKCMRQVSVSRFEDLLKGHYVQGYFSEFHGGAKNIDSYSVLSRVAMDIVNTGYGISGEPEWNQYQQAAQLAKVGIWSECIY